MTLSGYWTSGPAAPHRVDALDRAGQSLMAGAAWSEVAGLVLDHETFVGEDVTEAFEQAVAAAAMAPILTLSHGAASATWCVSRASLSEGRLRLTLEPLPVPESTGTWAALGVHVAVELRWPAPVRPSAAALAPAAEHAVVRRLDALAAHRMRLLADELATIPALSVPCLCPPEWLSVLAWALGAHGRPGSSRSLLVAGRVTALDGTPAGIGALMDALGAPYTLTRLGPYRARLAVAATTTLPAGWADWVRRTARAAVELDIVIDGSALSLDLHWSAAAGVAVVIPDALVLAADLG